MPGQKLPLKRQGGVLLPEEADADEEEADADEEEADADEEEADADEADDDDEAGTFDLHEWLVEQEVPSQEDEVCSDKFRITVVNDHATLFHGHNCGTALGYTLISRGSTCFLAGHGY